MSKAVLVAGMAAGVTVLDQATKILVRATIPFFEVIPVIPGFFELTHLSNRGAAFGILGGLSETWRLPILLGVTAVALVVLVQFVRHTPDHHRGVLAALGGILGGAFGNLIDRALAGEVTDFLSFHVAGYYWPAFNIADSFITVGCGVLVLHSLLVDDGKSPPPPKA